MIQLTLNLTIHQKESNPVSQAFLDEHREQFSHDTFKVLSELVNGRTLDYKTALNEGLTGDLRRRIKDIRDMNIPVSDNWVSTQNERKFKQYFMKESDKVEALRVLVNKLKKAA